MVSRKSVIAFGMVAIPIAMVTATQDNDIHFNQLHKEDSSRIRYKKTCAHCGKEITAEDIVKGFEYDKDQYVVVADEEIEKIKTEKEKSIQILHFAQLNQISPVYYDKTYQAAPEPGGEKAFELLRAALMAEQKVAIGKTVIGTRDTLMAIIPREDGILISTMLYQDEIRELPKRGDMPAVDEAEHGLLVLDLRPEPLDEVLVRIGRVELELGHPGLGACEKRCELASNIGLPCPGRPVEDRLLLVIKQADHLLQ
jgi:DNA end-binding protein Ku